MALKEDRKKSVPEGREPQMPARRTIADDVQALAERVRENPLIAVATVGFLALVLAVGLLIMVANHASTVEANTDFADALQTEDPALRLTQLERVAKQQDTHSATAAYLAGETAIRAQQYEEARANFERVLDEHGDSEYAPRAAEGLAFLLENDGKLEEALAAYQQIIEDYPDSYTATTLPRHIGALLEELDRPKEAIEFYMEQFRRFPKGQVTAEAMQAISTLQESGSAEVSEAAEAAFKTLSEESPERFQQEFSHFYVAPEDDQELVDEDLLSPEAEPTAEEAPAEDAPAEEAPAEEAPAEDAPAEDAPAEDAPA
ncbi:MAG: tetratricopeptide repeat protein, partial [Candidatus Hydrogenedentota bacterium]